MSHVSFIWSSPHLREWRGNLSGHSPLHVSKLQAWSTLPAQPHCSPTFWVLPPGYTIAREEIGRVLLISRKKEHVTLLKVLLTSLYLEDSNKKTVVLKKQNTQKWEISITAIVAIKWNQFQIMFLSLWSIESLKIC